MSMKVKYEENPEAQRMVKNQLERRGLHDRRVLDVMARVPRHLFVGGKNKSEAYGDFPIGIGHGQTISQPYMVAYMTEVLELTGCEKVLEIGTGSGYQTVLLAELSETVYTIERIPELGEQSRQLLESLGYENVIYKIGDGSTGWAEAAPFDRILVTAAAPFVSATLKHQLTDNGIFVVPVGDYRDYQTLTIIIRRGNSFTSRTDMGCRFVPLLGEEGFD